MAGEYIWVCRWEEFQSFQTKRGKPWSPPWLRIYPRLLDDVAFLELSEQTRSLLLEIWMLFASTRLTVPKDTRYLARRLHRRVLTRQLEALNQAGFIDFCSGTVLEQRRNAFWNGSNLEENRQEQPPLPLPELQDPGNGTGGEDPLGKIEELLARAAPDDLAW